MSLHHYMIAQHVPNYHNQTLAFVLMNRAAKNEFPDESLLLLAAAFPETFLEWLERSKSPDGRIESDDFQ